MSKKPIKTNSILSKEYKSLLKEIKEKVFSSQLKAAIAVNSELIKLYWEIGNSVHRKQQREGWGTKIIEKLAKDGDPFKYPFKSGKVKKNPLAFSFSGLKTSVLYEIKGKNSKKTDKTIINSDKKKDIAASFQHTAFMDIIDKAKKALNLFNLKSVYIGGGVSNNKYLRKLFEKNISKDIKIFWPSKNLSLDNAAMVAGLGFHVFQENKKSHSFDLNVYPKLQFDL